MKKVDEFLLRFVIIPLITFITVSGVAGVIWLLIIGIWEIVK